MKLLKESDFIQEIRQELSTGHTFIPLVGSGVSSRSGILMGREFSKYLAYTLFRVIAPYDRQQSLHIAENRLDIQVCGWPANPPAEHISKAIKWLRSTYDDILLTRYGASVRREINGFEFDTQDGSGIDNILLLPLTPDIFELTATHRLHEWKRARNARLSGWHDRLFVPMIGPIDSTTSEEYIIEEGIRCLYDWRRTLRFLSSVFPASNQPRSGKSFERHSERATAAVGATTCDQSTVDAFATHITSGKRPNLAHMAIAHLSRPLRCRQVLTTNFDSLLEESFRQLSLPYALIEVHVGGEFPDPSTIRQSPSIIKLHGGLFETRADPSLDEAPSDSEKARFRQLLLGRNYQDNQVSLPSHLFVVGYSGTDARIIQLIKHALDYSDEHVLKVFWLTHSARSTATLKQLFPEAQYTKHFRVAEVNRSDLLLYEMYQELTYTLPGGGLSFEFSHQVPPEPRSSSSAELTALASKIADILLERQHFRHDSPFTGSISVSGSEIDVSMFSEQLEKAGGSNGRSYIAAVSTGAIRLFSLVYKAISNRGQCLWIELDDHTQAESVLSECMRLIALEVGAHPAEHLRHSPPYKSKNDKRGYKRFCDELLQHLGLNASNWTLIMYGRNLPGSCGGLIEHAWTNDEYGDFKRVRDLLTSLGFTVVYLPYTEMRSKREARKRHFVQTLSAFCAPRLEDIEEYHSDSAHVPIKNYGDASCLQASVTWTNDDEEHRRRLVDYLFLPALDIAHNLVKTGVAQDEIISTYKQQRAQLQQTSALLRDNEEPFYTEDIEGNDLRRHKEPSSDLKDNDPECKGTGFEKDILMRFIGEWLCKGDNPPTGTSGGPPNADTFYNRLQFSYAITLFRQSRHVSAFYSEAVFPCPQRFNTQGWDNDLARAQVIRRWIRRLESFGILLRKPGGYCWKYRDVRLGIRYLLEQASPIVLRSEVSGDGQRMLNCGAEIRARTHHWIALWYENAFMTTGHPGPLIESVFHRLMCIKSSIFAKPASLVVHDEDDIATRNLIARYRVDLAASSLAQISKLLAIGHTSYSTWNSDNRCDSVFNETAYDEIFNSSHSPLKVLDTLLTNVSCFGIDCDEFFRTLRSHCDDGYTAAGLLNRPEISELGFYRTHLPIFGPLVSDFQNVFQKYLPAMDGGANPCYTIQSNLKKVSKKIEIGCSQSEAYRGYSTSFDLPARVHAASALSRHWRNWRWMSCIDAPTESLDDLYDSAGLSYLSKALNESVQENDEGLPVSFDADKLRLGTPRKERLNAVVPELDSQLVTDWVVDKSRALGTWCVAVEQDKLRDAVEATAELAYQYVIRVRLEDSVREVESHLPNERKEPCPWHVDARYFYNPRWAQVCFLCRNVLDMARHLRACLVDVESELIVRTRTMYGLALGQLGRFYEANRHLSQATSRLSQTTSGLDNSKLAIIRLRRAEICLSKVSAIAAALSPGVRLGESYQPSTWLEHVGALAHSVLDYNERPFIADRDTVLKCCSIQEALTCGDERFEETHKRLKRVAIASLNEASDLLQSSSYLMSGSGHLGWWAMKHRWLMLETYKLAGAKALAEEQIQPHLVKSRRDTIGVLRKAFEEALLLSEGCAWFQYRTCGVALAAAQAMGVLIANSRDSGVADSSSQKDLCDLIRSRWNSLKQVHECPEGPSLVANYFKGLKNSMKSMDYLGGGLTNVS